MPTVVGLRFEDGGAIHFFTPGQSLVAPGDLVVTESARGQQLARVVFGPKDVANDRVPVALRPVLRVATPEDCTRIEQIRALLTNASTVVPERIQRLALPMKLIDIVAQEDGARITVFFAAEGRIDFRELVRDLVAALGVRILMHQVGARDHAKMLGGIASCGRELCCSTWMPFFEPVSMRMAKEQSLFLNPSKFSGNCGKLKCCLRYEYDFYAESHDGAPELGDEYETPDGWGRVAEINIVKGTFFVDVPHVGRVEMSLGLSANLVGCGKPGGTGTGCAGCSLAGDHGPGNSGACASCHFSS